MKRVSPVIQSWIELVEKALMAITLVIGIAVSVIKGIEFLAAKKQQVVALTEESHKRKEILDRFADTYLGQLDGLSKDISKIDEELEKEIWKNSTGWEVKAAIRQEKAKDRLELLQNLGNQILQLKKLGTEK